MYHVVLVMHYLLTHTKAALLNSFWSGHLCILKTEGKSKYWKKSQAALQNVRHHLKAVSEGSKASTAALAFGEKLSCAKPPNPPPLADGNSFSILLTLPWDLLTSLAA